MSVSAMNILISGQVQGVGFRPFVYNLAQRLSVCGFVRNGPEGVFIHAQADLHVLETFKKQLVDEQPSMSVIDELVAEPTDVDDNCTNFVIVASEAGDFQLGVTPDANVCQFCLSELFNPQDRRFQYPFINCTNCGPRYSLVTALPYDRVNTTMSKFTQCSECLEEYSSASNRRFHAQPNACANCGPTLSFYLPDNSVESHDEFKFQSNCDPIAETITLIKQGQVVAVKGVGGFHLVCDAHNDKAIKRLRALKQRDAKPFAVMGANMQSLGSIVDVTPQARQRLQGQDAPIVLCPRLDENDVSSILPDSVATGLACLGVMLPHSPLHYLLFHYAAGGPVGTSWLDEPQELMLVMTSANRSGNPLIFENDKAFRELKGIADGFLVHNRDIHTRCDDSVINAMNEELTVVRRGRGLSPQVVQLPACFEQLNLSVLAVGAFYKNTVCLTKGRRAYVSQYIGDLDSPDCCRALNEAVEHLKTLLDIEPDLVVSDQHPNFYSSQFAERYSKQNGVPMMKVQHHHAHVAAVMAEHQLLEPTLGLTLDGLGLGENGELWGGELLYVDQGDYERIAHLSALPMVGGEKASKEPWRMAAGALHRLDQSAQIKQRFSTQSGVEVIEQLLSKKLNCPETTSAGRLFDAVAGLLGVCVKSQYEAHAAMLLESLVHEYLRGTDWPVERPLVNLDAAGNLDCLPLLNRLARCTDPAYGAALFHTQLIDGLVRWTLQHSNALGVKNIVLAGGCFLNSFLLKGVQDRLQEEERNVFLAVQMPCNDGAISLGQAQNALEIEYQSFIQKQQKQPAGLAVGHSQSVADSEEIKVCV